MWIKLLLAGGAALLLGAMVLLYNHTMKQNGELQTKLDDANESIAALQAASLDNQQKFTDLAKVIDQHSAALAQTAVDLAKKQTLVTRVYRETDDATRSILDTDLPQFRCLYETGGCEATGVQPDKPR